MITLSRIMLMLIIVISYYNHPLKDNAYEYDYDACAYDDQHINDNPVLMLSRIMVIVRSMLIMLNQIKIYVDLKVFQHQSSASAISIGNMRMVKMILTFVPSREVWPTLSPPPDLHFFSPLSLHFYSFFSQIPHFLRFKCFC